MSLMRIHIQTLVQMCKQYIVCAYSYTHINTHTYTYTLAHGYANVLMYWAFNVAFIRPCVCTTYFDIFRKGEEREKQYQCIDTNKRLCVNRGMNAVIGLPKILTDFYLLIFIVSKAVSSRKKVKSVFFLRNLNGTQTVC